MITHIDVSKPINDKIPGNAAIDLLIESGLNIANIKFEIQYATIPLYKRKFKVVVSKLLNPVPCYDCGDDAMYSIAFCNGDNVYDKIVFLCGKCNIGA